MNSRLSTHHRLTIEKIFGHPAGGNIDWRQVLSVLEDLGSVNQERNGKFTVTPGPETEVFEGPRGKGIDQQLTVLGQPAATAVCVTRSSSTAPKSPTRSSSRPASIVFDQAENRLHIIKAVLIRAFGTPRRPLRDVLTFHRDTHG